MNQSRLGLDKTVETDRRQAARSIVSALLSAVMLAFIERRMCANYIPCTLGFSRATDCCYSESLLVVIRRSHRARTKMSFLHDIDAGVLERHVVANPNIDYCVLATNLLPLFNTPA